MAIVFIVGSVASAVFISQAQRVELTKKDIQEIRSTQTPAQRINIDTISTDVLVRKTSSNQTTLKLEGFVEFVGNQNYKEPIMTIDTTASDLLAKIRPSKQWYWFVFNSDIKLIVEVPQEYDGSLNIRTVSGDITVENDFLNESIETTSGQITIQEAQLVQASSTSGDIFVNNAFVVDINTVSGDVIIKRDPIRSSVESGRIHTVSGDVRIPYGAGVKFDTVSGDVKGEYNQGDQLIISTTSGDLSISTITAPSIEEESLDPRDHCLANSAFDEEVGACIAQGIVLGKEAKQAARFAIMLQSTMFHTIQNYERTEEGYTFILQTPERKPYAFNVPFVHSPDLDEEINSTEVTLCKESDRGEKVCEEQHIACTAIYDPVCAVDKNGKLKTYGSSCTACTTGFVERYAEGECTEAKEAPTTAEECASYHSTAVLMEECRPGEHSVAEIEGEQCCIVNVDPKPMIECPESLKPSCQYEKVCTMQYDPVCGTYENESSRTFGNGCGACADPSVTSYTKGECEQAILSQEEIDQLISEANYCTTKDECAKLPSRCPYGCQSMVNINEVETVLSAIDEEDYMCEKACAAVVFPVDCIEGTCQVQHPNQQN